MHFLQWLFFRVNSIPSRPFRMPVARVCCPRPLHVSVTHTRIRVAVLILRLPYYQFHASLKQVGCHNPVHAPVGRIGFTFTVRTCFCYMRPLHASGYISPLCLFVLRVQCQAYASHVRFPYPYVARVCVIVSGPQTTRTTATNNHPSKTPPQTHRRRRRHHHHHQ